MTHTLTWAIPAVSAAAYATLLAVSPRHAREAAHTALRLGIAATILSTPIIYARS